MRLSFLRVAARVPPIRGELRGGLLTAWCQETLATIFILMDHCFEYLRQSIMCHGDTTLEKVVTDKEGRLKPDIDGWGTTHQCRSWNMLFDFAESRRVKVIGD